MVINGRYKPGVEIEIQAYSTYRQLTLNLI